MVLFGKGPDISEWNCVKLCATHWATSHLGGVAPPCPLASPLGHVASLEPFQVVRGHGRAVFGRAQIIAKDPDTGVLWGGSDGRGDGCAIGW